MYARLPPRKDAPMAVLIKVALQRLLAWWFSKSPKTRLRHCLATAQTFEEWEEAAFELDELRSADLW
jgi:TAG lipase/lysophosphatidylethanolamine acyltransferase